MTGVHWNNSLWSTYEEDYQKVAPFDDVLIIIAAYGGDPRQIERQYRMCERLHGMGKRIIYRIESRGFQDVDKFVQKWTSILQSLLPFGDCVQLNNEPNHPGENFGGPDWAAAVNYNAYFLRLAPALKAAVPGLKLGFPGLAVQQNEVNWWTACREAMELADWVGCHVYAQFENWDDPAWGRRYELLQALTDKPIIITEYGDSTPGRPIEEKAQRYKAWLEELPGQIEAAYCYLLSSPHDEWAEFVLNDKAIEIICSAKTQSQPEAKKKEAPIMPEQFTYAFEGDFVRFDRENPGLKLKPTSEAIYLSQGRAVQLANKGVLAYVPGERTTLHKPYRSRKKA